MTKSSGILKNMIGVWVVLMLIVFSAIYFFSSPEASEVHGEFTSVPRVVYYQAANFFGLILLLIILLKGRIQDSFVQRHESLTAEIKEAKRIKEEAQQKHEEYHVKIKSFEKQAQHLLEQIRKEGEETKKRMISETQKLVESIEAEAKRSAHNEVERARSELYEEVLEQAIAGARQLLSKSVQENDQQRLQKEFVKKIEAVQ